MGRIPSNTPGFTNICVNMDMDVNVDVDLDANVDADVVAVVHLDAAEGGTCRRRGMFGFQRLDVYRAWTQFLGLTSKLVARIPRGHRDLIDQLRRAALSVPLNIAEGSGKFEPRRCALLDDCRGSALECAAGARRTGSDDLFSQADLNQARELLERVVSMLTGLIRP